MSAPAPRPNRALLIKLALGLLALLFVAALAARGIDFRALLDRSLALIRGAGPVAFFTGMALLPVVGAPLSVFLLTAGPLFAPTFGMVGVILLAEAAIAVNLVISYFLARRALRPLLEKLCARLGYRLPRASADDEVGLIVLLRFTPGPPFPAQNYLLALAEVSFWRYFLVSLVCMAPAQIAFIVFGDAMLHGQGRAALLALGLMAALAAATRLVRRHYGRKGPPA